ncbi:MAG TPA: ribonuclease P protein component [Armatimonadota bacterium]|jgi:ribonuclease P protein component
MLSRQRRLRADRDWDALFQRGFGVSGPVVALRVCATPGRRRLGVSVGKKLGGAVERNRIKRRLRAIALARWESLPEADMALLARPGAAAADFAALDAAVMELADRARKRIP